MDETIVTTLDSLKNENQLEPYLIVIAGHHIGKLYNLESRVLVAGRSPDCDIWIEDSTISRKHFQISRDGQQCLIEDLQSTNGTFINGKRVQTTLLNAGDKIQISNDTIIQFDYFDEDRKISEQKRYEMGVRDPVTCTYNKSYFLQRISDEFSFSQRQDLPLSVVMFDIDFFKAINDNHGHLAGDKVLHDTCKLVSGLIRSDDVFCRYGGEEFVIIMRNTDCQSAVNLAERIRRAIEANEIPYDGKMLRVTVSAGISTHFKQNYRDYVALLSECDKFLYQSKGNGRNRVSAVCLPSI